MKSGIVANSIRGMVAGFVVFAAYGAMSALVATKPEVNKQRPQERSYAVETTVIKRGDFTPSIKSFGTVQDARNIQLRVPIAGEVLRISPLFKEGAVVTAGEFLAGLDPFDYQLDADRARANLEEASAAYQELEETLRLREKTLTSEQKQLELAQRELGRAQELNERGITTEAVLDEKMIAVSERLLAYETAVSDLAREKSRLVQRKAAVTRGQADLRSALKVLEETTLLAPFDAVVRAVEIEEGNELSVREVVGSLYSVDQFEVQFTLSDQQYGRIRHDALERPIRAEWRLGEESVVYEGVITRVSPDVKSERGGIPVIAEITITGSERPIPGSFVEVTLDDRIFPTSFRVPESSLYGGDIVYAVVDERLDERRVSVLAYDNGHVLIDGDIEDGETVLTTRMAEIGDGFLVKDVSQ